MARKAGLDGVAGILLVYMMFTHIVQRCGLTDLAVYKHLYAVLFFFMAWFFFKGGRFARDRSVREEGWLVWRRLVLPYLTFSVLGWATEIVYFVSTGNATWKNCLYTPLHTLWVSGSVTGNLPLWFLLVLAGVRMLYCLSKQAKIPSVVTALAAFVAAWLLNIFVPIPMYPGAIAAGLCFYASGSVLGRYADNRLVWIGALAVFLTVFFLCPSWVDMRSNQLRAGLYPLFFLSSLAAILVVDGLAGFGDRHGMPRLFFGFVGRHSMVFFLWHWIILTLCLILFERFVPPQWQACIMGVSVLVFPALLTGWTERHINPSCS